MAAELDDRFTRVIHEAACQGYDSGCKDAIGGPWRNPFANALTPDTVFKAAFKIGRDVTLRQVAARSNSVAVHPLPPMEFAPLVHDHDDVERQIAWAAEIQRLADRCSDLEAAVALFGSPTTTRKPKPRT